MSDEGLGGIAIADWDSRLRSLVAAHGTEAGSVKYLEELRWPNGVYCPRCSSEQIGFLATRGRHYCRSCAYQFRVTVGTVLHDSHVPVATWLTVVGLMLRAERGFPATRLQALLGGSYKTAWFIEHRIRAALSEALANGVVSDRLSAGEWEPESNEGKSRDDAGTALIGRYHRVASVHRQAYVAEARWRASRGTGQEHFRATVEALLRKKPVRYQALIGGEQRSAPLLQPR